MRTEHLRPLLDNEEDSNKFFEECEWGRSPTEECGPLLLVTWSDVWSRRRWLSNSYALATRAGCESIVVTDMDPRATVLSIDGVGVDLICHRAMMCAAQRMPDGETLLPFVLQFYGHPSTHLWEVHEIPQVKMPACSPWVSTKPLKQSRNHCSLPRR